MGVPLAVPLVRRSPEAVPYAAHAEASVLVLRELKLFEGEQIEFFLAAAAKARTYDNDVPKCAQFVCYARLAQCFEQSHS